MNTEHPIIFSTPMVRVILESRKTQTRRVIARQPDFEAAGCEPAGLETPPRWWDFWGADSKTLRVKCPYFFGQTLWVRETIWLPPPITPKMQRDGADTWPEVSYMTDNAGCDEDGEWFKENHWHKVPAIHMKRQYSRIVLSVAEVRAQHVQDIGTFDAVAEGIVWAGNPRWSFSQLWDSINGKRKGGQYSWKKNPWVWVITFKVSDLAKKVGEK